MALPGTAAWFSSPEAGPYSWFESFPLLPPQPPDEPEAGAVVEELLEWTPRPAPERQTRRALPFGGQVCAADTSSPANDCGGSGDLQDRAAPLLLPSCPSLPLGLDVGLGGDLSPGLAPESADGQPVAPLPLLSSAAGGVFGEGIAPDVALMLLSCLAGPETPETAADAALAAVSTGWRTYTSGQSLKDDAYWTESARVC